MTYIKPFLDCFQFKSIHIFQFIRILKQRVGWEVEEYVGHNGSNWMMFNQLNKRLIRDSVNFLSHSLSHLMNFRFVSIICIWNWAFHGYFLVRGWWGVPVQIIIASSVVLASQFIVWLSFILFYRERKIGRSYFLWWVSIQYQYVSCCSEFYLKWIGRMNLSRKYLASAKLHIFNVKK